MVHKELNWSYRNTFYYCQCPGGSGWDRRGATADEVCACCFHTLKHGLDTTGYFNLAWATLKPHGNSLSFVDLKGVHLAHWVTDKWALSVWVTFQSLCVTRQRFYVAPLIPFLWLRILTAYHKCIEEPARSVQITDYSQHLAL